MSTLTSHLLICKDNHYLTATLSSNQTVLLPLANSQDPIRLIKTRLNGVVNVQVTIDLGSAKECQSFFVFDTNLTAAATVEWRRSTDNFAANDIQIAAATTTGSFPYQVCHALLLTEAITTRYLRVIFSDASSAAGYIEFGIVGVCPNVQFTRTLSPGARIEAIDTTGIELSPAGIPHITLGVTRTQITWTLDSLSRADMLSLYDIARTLDRKSLFVSLFPLLEDAEMRRRTTLYGGFENYGQMSSILFNVWDAQGVIFQER